MTTAQQRTGIAFFCYARRKVAEFKLIQAEKICSSKPKFRRVPTLNVNLLEGCEEPFIVLVKQHGVAYEEMPLNSLAGSVRLVGVFRDDNLWAATLTTTVSAFRTNKRSHEVIVTTRSKGCH
jgi:hypothetical protein